VRKQALARKEGDGSGYPAADSAEDGMPGKKEMGRGAGTAPSCTPPSSYSSRAFWHTRGCMGSVL